MPVQPWRVVVLVLGGAVVGIGIGGLPNQREDAPLRVRAEATTTTTTVATTTSTIETTTTTALPTSTTRRRP